MSSGEDTTFAYLYISRQINQHALVAFLPLENIPYNRYVACEQVLQAVIKPDDVSLCKTQNTYQLKGNSGAVVKLMNILLAGLRQSPKTLIN